MHGEPKTPNWDHWKKLNIVSIFEAISLSVNEEPDKLSHTHAFGYGILNVPLFQEQEKKLRLTMALTAIDLTLSAFEQVNDDEALESVEPCRPDVSSNIPLVRLAEFGKWAYNKGLTLPEQFPTQKYSPKIKHDGSVSLDFPYECKLISVIAQVMWDNYEKGKPVDLGTQKKVGMEIDEAMGWTNEKDTEKGEASRSAKAIIPHLRPDIPNESGLKKKRKPKKQ